MMRAANFGRLLQRLVNGTTNRGACITIKPNYSPSLHFIQVQNRQYSQKSHSKGVLFNQFFLHSAFLNCLQALETKAAHKSGSVEKNHISNGIKIFGACLRAHSKLEEHHFITGLPGIDEMEAKKYPTFKTGHAQEHQQLKIIEKKLTSNSNLDDLHTEIVRLIGMLSSHFEKVEDAVCENYGQVFTNNEIIDIQQDAKSKFSVYESQFVDEHKDDADLVTYYDILNLFGAYLLVKQVTGEILAHMIKNDDKTVLKSILHDIRKATPLIFWTQLEIDFPALADVEVDDI
ncbi:sepH [Acrasis kona]|uniref:SepH n=1 Tax=Acrasis kona TaxID=1008807 RepID=A0AAW2Z4W7_9EUKA